MAVKLRLKRFGRKKLPIYRLVVADERAPRDGKVIEEVGFYHPTAEPKVFDYKQDRIEHWLSVGAQPTDPVQRLLAEAGLLPKVDRIRGKAEAEAKAKEAAEKAAAEKAAADAKAAEEKAAADAKAAEEAAAVAEAPAETEEAPKAEAPAEDAKSDDA